MGQVKSKKQKVSRYTPELGQFTFGSQAWQHYEMPEYAEALLNYIFEEVERVYWNINQKQWERYINPKLPFLEIRPYWWGKETAKKATLPNFKFGKVAISWYKYPGRGMSTNVRFTEKQWIRWFDKCLNELRKFEKEKDKD